MKTKLHKLFDAVHQESVYMRMDKKSITHIDNVHHIEIPVIASYLDALREVPLFCIEDELVMKFPPDEVEASLEAMLAADMATLPFDQMVIELKHDRGHDFGYLHQDRKGKFACQIFEFYEDKGPGGDRVVCHPTGTVLEFKKHEHEVRLHFTAVIAEFLQDDYQTRHWAMSVGERLATSAAKMLTVGLVLLSTRGVKKEIIQPEEKLNRIRKKSNRSPVPAFTYVHVGSVYDRSGVERTVSAEHVRRSPRMHMRRAHVRSVRIGAGRVGRKEVLIPACLVNYDPGMGEPPKSLPQRYKVAY